MSSSRRSFLTSSTAAGVAAGTLGFPMIAKAQQTFAWKGGGNGKAVTDRPLAPTRHRFVTAFRY
ncbi:MAG: twin-arginine translocation signal domain-containing protein [Usitatibacter sp.]